MKAYIKAISYYLPKRIVTNEEIQNEFPSENIEKIAKSLGICERHISDDGETAKDMAVNAAKQLFKDNKIDTNDIDFVLFCTQSPDYHLPSTACIIQKELNLPTTCGSFDYDLGCSGFVYGLSIAKGYILGGMCKNILLLTGDTIQMYINKKDKGNRMLFGEAASATLVSTDGFAEICDFSFGTDGSGAQNIIVESGCARKQKIVGDLGIDESGAFQSSDFFYMNGSEVFSFTLDKVPVLVNNVLVKNELNVNDIDEFVFHQANKFTLNSIRKICGFDKIKFYNDVTDVGNTTSSTIPIALKRFLEKDKTAKIIMLAGFGIGLSWAGCIIKLN
ncbi:3-oxoacyl-ACP synthase III family protein [Segatella paludivivens]|uniref:3-oxoacyl-ACP synthase III family protein n=1 Tax=Segatella paludivivens TaxID=185294 RepID=UPI00036A1395|nr:ketoacyl-ACP synthase III [Segatella paludivivens]